MSSRHARPRRYASGTSHAEASTGAGKALMFSCRVIATTGELFSDFAPYVASVNDAGTVAFQAALRGGGTGVFTGSGGAVAQAAAPSLLAGVTSHPDLNDDGATSFYGDLPGGG